MDCSAVLAYGIKLPKDFSIVDDECPLEVLENEIHNGKYDLLEVVTTGCVDEPQYIIAISRNTFYVDWTAEPIDVSELHISYTALKQLGDIKECFELSGVRAKYYLGCYVSY